MAEPIAGSRLNALRADLQEHPAADDPLAEESTHPRLKNGIVLVTRFDVEQPAEHGQADGTSPARFR